MFDQKIAQIAKESQQENDRLKKESEDMKKMLESKIQNIERDYVSIAKHEEILNEEL